MEIKNIIIFLLVFFLILWLQHNDDIKFNKKRESLYDKIKIPLVATIFVILIKDCNINECITKFGTYINNNQSTVNIPNTNKVFNDIYIGPPNF